MKRRNSRLSLGLLLIVALVGTGTVGTIIYKNQQKINKEINAIVENSNVETPEPTKLEVSPEVEKIKKDAELKKLDAAHLRQQRINDLSKLLINSKIDYDLMLQTFDKVYEQDLNIAQVLAKQTDLSNNDLVSMTGFAELMNDKDIDYKELGITKEQYDYLIKNGFFVRLVTDVTSDKQEFSEFLIYYKTDWAYNKEVSEKLNLTDYEKSVRYDNVLKTYEHLQKNPLPVYCIVHQSDNLVYHGEILVTFDNAQNEKFIK